MNSPVVKTIVGILAIAMGLLGLYFFTKQLFNKKAGIILSSEGIIDNMSALKFGLIPWGDIAAIRKVSVQVSVASKQDFVGIVLKDPDSNIGRVTNPIKRKLMETNAAHYGAPINISSNSLSIKHEALLNLVTTYFEKYKS